MCWILSPFFKLLRVKPREPKFSGCGWWIQKDTNSSGESWPLYSILTAQEMLIFQTPPNWGSERILTQLSDSKAPEEYWKSLSEWDDFKVNVWTSKNQRLQYFFLPLADTLRQMECVIFYWHRCTREYLLQLCSLYAKILLEGKAQGAEHDLLEQKKISGDNGDISNGMIYQYRNETNVAIFRFWQCLTSYILIILTLFWKLGGTERSLSCFLTNQWFWLSIPLVSS